MKSIKAFNKDSIPLFLCVPRKDAALFDGLDRALLGNVILLLDEEVISANGSVDPLRYSCLDGRITQQIIKTEFWRYWLKLHPQYDAVNYVCVDSESEFIRDFYRSDFLKTEDIPFTICHNHQDLLAMAAIKKISKIKINFENDCALIKEVFHREGPDYAFSPTPVIWSSRVWEELDRQYLAPIGSTIWEAIIERPNELHWYGEALLHFKSIPLYPKGPLFRVYHYNWEYFARIKAGETIDVLRRSFLGVLKQSSWEHTSDYGTQRTRKSLASRLARGIRQWVRRQIS